MSLALNVAAPVNSLGYGLVSLNIILALHRAGVRMAWWPIGPVDAPANAQAVLNAAYEQRFFYPKGAASLRIYHQFDLAMHVGSGLRCSLPIFELDRFLPNEVHHLTDQDIIFAPSQWAGRVLVANGVDASRVRVAPFGVDTSVFRPVEDKPREGPTVFLNCGKWEVRKGHDVLVDAFNDAFTPNDDVVLAMLCQNPVAPNAAKYNDEWNRLYMSSTMGKAGKVQLLPRLATSEDVAKLMANADCGVFPSRAEGWGMESAEMLAMGKQVIITNYSAHTEYATGDNSLLIEIDDLEEAFDGVWFDPTKEGWGDRPGAWASLGERQHEQLVEHLRTVHRKKQAGESLFNRAGVETFQRLTWDACAGKIAEVL